MDIKTYQKQYYLKNKERIQNYNKRKILCKSCNREICIISYKRHLLTNFHKKNLLANDNYENYNKIIHKIIVYL